MGFRGGVKLTPPHILVFKYPSRDRVKCPLLCDSLVKIGPNILDAFFKP